MDRNEEHSLHASRKFYRESNPFKFSSTSVNYTDSRLKFKRNIITLLKAYYLSMPSMLGQFVPDQKKHQQKRHHGESSDDVYILGSIPASKELQETRLSFLECIDHLLKVNIFKQWDILILNRGQTFESVSKTDPRVKYVSRHLDWAI